MKSLAIEFVAEDSWSAALWRLETQVRWLEAEIFWSSMGLDGAEAER